MNHKWLQRCAGAVMLIIWSGLVAAGVAAILQMIEAAR